MVSLKFLVVLVLVVAVSCEPCHKHKKQHKKNKQHKRCRAGTDVAVQGGLRGSCGFLFKGLKGHCKLYKPVYNELIDLKVPTNIDSFLSFFFRLSLGTGGAVDLLLPGLGDLLSRLLAAGIRLISCVLGLIGDRDFCGKGHYKKYFNINVLDVFEVDILLKKLKCRKARSQVEGYVEQSSGGKGMNSFPDSEKVVLQLTLDIADIVDKKDDVTKKDLTALFNRLLSLAGIVGNGYSKDLGNNLTIDAINACDKFLVEAGCPSLKNKKENIIVVIKGTNDDDDDSPWGDLSDDGSGTDGDDGGIDFDGNDDEKKDTKDSEKKDDGGGNKVSGTNDTALTPLGGYLEIFFKPILKGKGRCRVSHDILNYLINIRNPTSFADVANFISNLGIVLASVVDTLVPGLGDLIGRIILYIARAALCIKSNFPGYCSNNYVKVYKIDEDASDLEGLAIAYKVPGAKDQVLKVIHKHTKGKDVKTVIKGAQKNVLAACVRIGDLADKFPEDVYSQLYLQITLIVGCAANSFDKNHQLGNNITNSMSAVCDKYIQQKGYQPISESKADIKKGITTTDTTFMTTITTTTVVVVTTSQQTVQTTS